MLTRGRLSQSNTVCDQGAFENAQIRVGSHYQAVLPDLIQSAPCNTDLPTDSTRRPQKSKTESSFGPGTVYCNRGFVEGCKDTRTLEVAMYVPTEDRAEFQQFEDEATKKYKYTIEQALAMLHWHKYNVQHALDNLPNFCPFNFNWSRKEKKKFFIAVRSQKKDFYKIKQMIPQRSMREMVHFYYVNKKRQDVLEALGLYDTNRRGLCLNIPEKSHSSSSASNLLSWRRNLRGGMVASTLAGSTGQSPRKRKEEDALSEEFDRHMTLVLGKTGFSYRSNSSSDDDSSVNSDFSDRNGEVPRDKYSLPKGIYYGHDEFLHLARVTPSAIQEELEALEAVGAVKMRELRKLQEAVHKKNTAVMSGLDKFKPVEGLLKPTFRWTNQELLFTVQAIRKHGRNYKAIAELVGSKSESMICSFFNSFGDRYHLDELVAAYEQEKAQGIAQ